MNISQIFEDIVQKSSEQMQCLQEEYSQLLYLYENKPMSQTDQAFIQSLKFELAQTKQQLSYYQMEVQNIRKNYDIFNNLDNTPIKNSIQEGRYGNARQPSPTQVRATTNSKLKQKWIESTQEPKFLKTQKLIEDDIGRKLQTTSY